MRTLLLVPVLLAGGATFSQAPQKLSCQTTTLELFRADADCERGCIATEPGGYCMMGPGAMPTSFTLLCRDQAFALATGHAQGTCRRTADGAECTDPAGGFARALCTYNGGTGSCDQVTGSGSCRRLAFHSPLDVEQTVNVGFLVVDGVYNSELVAPYDVFHHTRFHTDPRPGMEVFTVSPDGKPVTTFEGLVLTPHYGFDDVPRIDVLVVPSAEHSMDTDLENREMMVWVHETGKSARYVVSLCDGAFVLAAAELLNGLRATTFPGDQDRFAETFPRVRLERGVSYVHDGSMITAEGGAKSYDPAMYLVDHLYGEEVAKKVGRGLVIDWP